MTPLLRVALHPVILIDVLVFALQIFRAFLQNGLSCGWAAWIGLNSLNTQRLIILSLQCPNSGNAASRWFWLLSNVGWAWSVCVQLAAGVQEGPRRMASLGVLLFAATRQ